MNDLTIARRMLKFTADGTATNFAAVVTALRQKGLSAYRAQSIAAQAARRERGGLEAQQWIGVSTAARLSGKSVAAIRRAAAFRLIKDARRDGGRWIFTVAALKAWLADESSHRRGRKHGAGYGHWG